MIPIIATRNTAEIEEAIASAQTGRPLLGASSGIDPTIYENGTATAAKAKYLMSVPSKGSYDPAQFAAYVASRESVDEVDVRMCLNMFAETIEKLVREYGAIKVKTPFGVLETMVSGSVEYSTTALDSEAHRPYLNFTPCDALKNAVSGLTYFNATEATAPFRVDTVRQEGTDEDHPFPMGSDVIIHGRNFKEDARVTLTDEVTNAPVSATLKRFESSTVLIVTIPAGLNVEHRQIVTVTQTYDGEDVSLDSNKPIYVAQALLPDHEIGLVKHGSRPDDSIAFDEGENQVVVSVTHNNGATHLLRDQAPKVWITVDFMDGSRHKVGTLDGLYDITVAEDTITFKMTDNTTELIDGDWWNRDVTLYIGWADGTVSEKTVHFLQM